MHQNPIRAGIVKELSDYPWSSYNEYIEIPRIVDTEYIYSVMDKKEFENFSRQESTEKALDDEPKPVRISDEEAKKRIFKISGLTNATEVQYLDKINKKHYLKKFKDAGMSIRQINRLTGISKGIVERS